jgi:hypothetical protein
LGYFFKEGDRKKEINRFVEELEKIGVAGQNSN